MQGRESPAEPGSGPARRFPVAAVDEILRDVVGSALREQRYEAGPCREAARDIAEVVKARVKDLGVPRYKIVVVTHIGQLGEQSLQIGSRCLWDPGTDTFSSFVFKNTSLFAVANVYDTSGIFHYWCFASAYLSEYQQTLPLSIYLHLR
ncbi:dynein light chain Tctex-type 5 isoform X2 [Aphelocoma coerulescens]|uniref:dynein light chain Tctex-type 5 isoform X2 n=1 Tax=Aphelocoma coerulescens TaxID=39617 RepID=UPI003604FDBB